LLAKGLGTHIFSQISKNNTQTCYQLTNHLQSSTLELNDNAQPLSYEHYYPDLAEDMGTDMQSVGCLLCLLG
jgi:hypothetical protein